MALAEDVLTRLEQRYPGLTDLEDPNAIEEDLMRLVPRDRWTFFGPAMVLLGRYTCTSRAAKCGECVMSDVCPKRDLP